MSGDSAYKKAEPHSSLFFSKSRQFDCFKSVECVCLQLLMKTLKSELEQAGSSVCALCDDSEKEKLSSTMSLNS